MVSGFYPNGKKKSLDIISNLPTELTEEILHFLPIRDAVKTSLLSRDWRNRWSSMPNLVFDRRSIPPTTTQEELDKVQPNLANFVNKVLSLHNGTLPKLHLNFFLQRSCLDVDHMILDASKKNLNDLAIRFGKWNAYQLPNCIFYCQSLRNVLVERCWLKLPPDFQPLRCLISLSLYRVKLTNETFEALVANVPRLKKLYVAYCKPLSLFNIHAPNLVEFFVAGVCEGINFRITTQIEMAVLCIFTPELSNRCNLEKVLVGIDSFQTVKGIRISQPFVEVSRRSNTLEKLQITYKYLKFVQLFVNIEDSKQVLATMCLCRSSPCLVLLQINVVWNREDAFLYEVEFWEERLRKEENVFHHLKFMSLGGFKGVLHDIGFTQYILLNAVVLTNFSIGWEESVSVDEKQHIVEKMMQYPRASSKTKILFGEKKLRFRTKNSSNKFIGCFR